MRGGKHYQYSRVYGTDMMAKPLLINVRSERALKGDPMHFS